MKKNLKAHSMLNAGANGTRSSKGALNPSNWANNTIREALAKQGIKIEVQRYSGIVILTSADGKREDYSIYEFKCLPWVRNFYLDQLEALINQ